MIVTLINLGVLRVANSRITYCYVLTSICVEVVWAVMVDAVTIVLAILLISQ